MFIAPKLDVPSRTSSIVSRALSLSLSIGLCTSDAISQAKQIVCLSPTERIRLVGGGC